MHNGAALQGANPPTPNQRACAAYTAQPHKLSLPSCLRVKPAILSCLGAMSTLCCACVMQFNLITQTPSLHICKKFTNYKSISRQAIEQQLFGQQHRLSHLGGILAACLCKCWLSTAAAVAQLGHCTDDLARLNTCLDGLRAARGQQPQQEQRARCVFE